MIIENKDGVLLTIKVRPNSSKFRIYQKDGLRVDLTSSTYKNKANKELVKELKKIFKSKVSLVSGHKSREKILLVKTEKSKIETLIRKMKQV